jgi:gamma-glutamyl-gamma-aminobutyrate hydrolase PuuD
VKAGELEVVKHLDTTSDGNGRGPGPVIAITALKRSEEECGRFPTSYVTATRLAGARPIVKSPFSELHPEDEIPPEVEIQEGLDAGDASLLEDVSGLILPGGGDIDPAIYGRPRHPRTHNVSLIRDRFELAALHLALDRDLPVLAICRGMQLLNVGLGGTLEQHLGDRPGRLPHDRDRPRAEPAHKVRVAPGTVLAGILGTTEVAVNSHHHQGLERVADELTEVGWAEDGVLEAVEARARKCVIAVQWHPEVMAPVDRTQAAIFGHFLDAARSYSNAGTRSPSVRSA